MLNSPTLLLSTLHNCTLAPSLTKTSARTALWTVPISGYPTLTLLLNDLLTKNNIQIDIGQQRGGYH